MARAGHDGGFHPISGNFADIAQNYRGEESTYKGTLKGAREGILAAFQQLLTDRNFGLGNGGLGWLGGGAEGAGGGLGGTGGGGYSPTDDGSAPMGRAQGFGGALAPHASQRAILGGHVRAAAKAIREHATSEAVVGGQEPSGAGVDDGYKGSYHKPGAPGDKRTGLSDRYVQAMSVAEAELARQGVSKEHLRAAAAIMVGNASAESELIPSTVHDHGTGYGIYGARDPRGGRPSELRRTNMLTWLKNNSYAKDSLIGQVRQQAIDSARRGGAAWAALKNATAGNIMAGGRTYEHYFEAPGRDNNRNAQISSAWRAHRDAIASQPAREGLNASIRQRAAAAHMIKGEANINLKLHGFPRGTRTEVTPTGGLFKNVRIDRGRAAPMADTGGTTER